MSGFLEHVQPCPDIGDRKIVVPEEDRKELDRVDVFLDGRRRLSAVPEMAFVARDCAHVQVIDLLRNMRRNVKAEAGLRVVGGVHVSVLQSLYISVAFIDCNSILQSFGELSNTRTHQSLRPHIGQIEAKKPLCLLSPINGMTAGGHSFIVASHIQAVLFSFGYTKERA